MGTPRWQETIADRVEQSVKLNTFFLNAGVPSELLKELPRLLSEVKYYSAFICYGQPDEDFSKKLVEDLRTRGVSCWQYSLDYIPGKRTWEEISQRRREAEKMIVLCSFKFLIREGVKKEIEEQIDENPDKMIPTSLDNTWREEGFSVTRGKRDLKHFLLDRNYADFSIGPQYEASLNKLLKGLERTDNP